VLQEIRKEKSKRVAVYNFIRRVTIMRHKKLDNTRKKENKIVRKLLDSFLGSRRNVRIGS
jgi:hypothetical protein